MSEGNRGGCPAVIGVVLAILAAVLFSGHSSLKSPDETFDILDELGIAWTGGGPPVIVFSNPG